MLELIGNVNPRPTDDLFALLYPAGLLSLALNAALTALCLIAYAFSFWLVRSHLSIDARSRRDITLECIVITALGCSHALFPVFFAVHLLARCFAYASISERAAKTIDGVKGRPVHVRIKVGFLRAFLIMLVAGLVVMPAGLMFLFAGSIAIYYGVVYASGVVLAILLNAIKKPHGLPGFLTPWRPAPRAKRALQVATIALLVLCTATILNSAVVKYHAPAPAAPTSATTSSTRLVSYNIRLGIALELNPANNWVNRKDAFSTYLSSLDADIIGVQEAYLFQIEDILSRMNALQGSTGRVYTFTGFGRDDGVHGGEHSAILFDSTRFRFLDGDTFWLSCTPDVLSKPWDPSNYRVCTWARLERVATGAQLVVFNTHYATGIAYATFHEPASRLIKDLMAAHAGGVPALLMGDFNMYNTTTAFDILLHHGTVPLVDTYSGPATYTMAPNFDATYTTTSNRKIDFILVNPPVTVVSCTIPRDWYGANQAYSDHYPVVVDCVA